VAPGAGIYEFTGSGDILSHNTMSGVSSVGIFVYQSPGDLVQHNTISGLLATGIEYATEDTTFTGNVVNDLLAGIYDEGGYTQDANTVSDNRGRGDGIGAYAGIPTDDSYTGNTFNHGQYGIETEDPQNTTYANNTTDDNSEAGVYIYAYGTGFSATLTGNTANGNRYGLYSQIPTSGTGNQASGNKVVNCYNVSCTNAAPGQGGAVAAPPHLTPGFARPPVQTPREVG
jgi:Periplasmic copper-binding protein (NosD)